MTNITEMISTPSVSTVKTKDSIAVMKDAELLESIDLSSTMDLHRSNLMRMQVKELLEECQLDIKGRKWTGHATEYLQELTNIISGASKDLFKTKESYSIKDRADRVVHVEKIHPLKVSKNNNGNMFLIEPIGCTKSQFGWTKKSGNAQMLPTFSLMLKLPRELFSSKDYLNYRYFDVSRSDLSTIKRVKRRRRRIMYELAYSTFACD